MRGISKIVFRTAPSALIYILVRERSEQNLLAVYGFVFLERGKWASMRSQKVIFRAVPITLIYIVVHERSEQKISSLLCTYFSKKERVNRCP